VQSRDQGRIGKDDVRILSRSNFERLIEELKQDSEGGEQDTLIRGILLREFCLNKKTNVFVVPERMLQQRDDVRGLIYRLLDYKILHNAGSALTHKSQPGTYQAFAIDIGCYAHFWKLDGRFNELDLSERSIKEKKFDALWGSTPSDVEAALLTEPIAEQP
jgi:hypothetical protein